MQLAENLYLPSGGKRVEERAAQIERFTEVKRDYGFSVVGYVRAMNETSKIDSSRLISDPDSLLETTRRLGVKEIVVAVTNRRGLPIDPLLECRMSGVMVTDFQTFLGARIGPAQLVGARPELVDLLRRFPHGLGRQPPAQTRA